MAVTPLRSLRVSDLTWEAWGAAAESRGMSVTKLVHVAMERELGRRSDAAVLGGYAPIAAGPPPAVPPPKRDDAAVSAIPRGRSVAKPDWKGGKKP